MAASYFLLNEIGKILLYGGGCICLIRMRNLKRMF